MGPHAGESEREIFNRKTEDISRTGKTFWLNRSYRAKPIMVQRLCEEAQREKSDCFCIFIEGGAVPIASDESAKQYSKDGLTWYDLPKGLTPVTGKIDSGAHAPVFDRLERMNNLIYVDLWNYGEFFDQKLPLKTRQGASTICAIKKDMSAHEEKMIARWRRIVAAGKLCEPFCVYLR
jgi:hypothetical protein